jgi:hypothetical protein
VPLRRDGGLIVRADEARLCPQAGTQPDHSLSEPF